MAQRTRGVIAYLLLAFGIAWVLWEIPIRLGVSVHSPLFQLAILPGAFAPAIAALIVRKWVTREGFGDAGLRPHLSTWRTYLVGWLLPIPVVAIILGLAVALGLSQPDFTFVRYVQSVSGQTVAPMPGWIWAVAPFQLLVTALIATPVLWGEEFGWRGYLQVRLLADRPLLAAVATGLIWGIWHLPINLRGYNFPTHPVIGLAVFEVGTVLLSIIFGWLRLRTGSVWASSLAHAATNAVGGSLTALLFAGGSNWIFVAYLGILGWLPLGIVCLWIVLSGRLKAAAAQQASAAAEQPAEQEQA